MEETMTSELFYGARGGVVRALSDLWKVFLFEGIVLVVLGFLAVAVPVIAGLTVTIVFGWLFLASGFVGLFTTFSMRHGPGFWWSLLSDVLGIVLGVWLLIQPSLGLVSLTYLLIAFFVVEGLGMVMFAIEHRRSSSRRWGWMLASGVLDLLLAALVVAGLPGAVEWALGLIVGINMVFGGSSMIGMALAAHADAG
jgi:uncharacterized membrane protein HdeD (DUF308 family)